MWKKRMLNKTCGMKDCKFTPNLKSLFDRFSRKISYNFFLICNFLKCSSYSFSMIFAENLGINLMFV